LDRDAVYGSLLLKNVGKQFGQNVNGLTGPTTEYAIKSYTNVDLALGYTLPVLKDKKVRLGLNLYNIFDNHSLIGFAGSTAAGTPLYWTDPGFSGFVTLSAGAAFLAMLAPMLAEAGAGRGSTPRPARYMAGCGVRSRHASPVRGARHGSDGGRYGGHETGRPAWRP
jgi:hypothetical protein